MTESKPIVLFIGTAVVSILAVSLVFRRDKQRKAKRDILDSILSKTAPVAAKEELDASGSLTVECLLDKRQMIITADAAIADYVFNGRFKDNYVRRPAVDEGLKALGMFHQGLIWNNELAIWKNVRNCFRMALNDASLRRAVSIAKQECRQLLEDCVGDKNTAVVNLLEVSRRVTFRVTLNVFFGIASHQFASLNIDEDVFIESIVAYFKAWEYFLVRPKNKWDPATLQNHKTAVAELNSQVTNLLNATAILLDSKTTDKSSSNGILFIDRLYKAYNAETESAALLQQGALEMLLAGTDTSSVTAYYALLGLAGETDLQDELFKEFTKDNSKKNVLLDSLINETLRFKPVGPVVLREAVKADANFPGVAIEQGAAVLVHLAEMNMREEYWDDPSVFHGRRFMKDTSKKNDSRQKTFFPFGEGPKGCIGMHLGRREVGAIVETIVMNYTMTIDGVETLDSLETHWDIANQPDTPTQIVIRRRVAMHEEIKYRK